jgi:hypothetical protein
MSHNIKPAQFFIWDTSNTASGPLDLPRLISRVQSGDVTAGTWVFVTLDRSWRRALDVPELLLFFQASHAQAKPHPARLALDVRSLRRLKLLAALTDHQIERFTRYVEQEQVPQWAVIVKQGDCGHAMYIILEGELHVRMKVHGKDTILAKLEVGDFFGDISLFDKGPRSADVIAAATSRLLKISAASFEALSREAPDLATPFLRAIAKTLTARIRAGNKHHGEFVGFAYSSLLSSPS